MSHEALLVDVADLDVWYPNGFHALKKVDLQIAPGCRTALVGTSGSGKSTLVKAMLGLLPKGSTITGQLKVAGLDIRHVPSHELRQLRGITVGYVGQDPFSACDPMHTVRHHVEAAWRMHRLVPPQNAAVDQLTQVGILDAARRAGDLPATFSGGMLQRASIAAGSVHQPSLMIADEPTSALDVELGTGVLDLIRRRSEALVLVTHDLGLVNGICDRVVVLDDGEVIERGDTATIFAAPTARATRLLVESASGSGARTSEPRTGGQVVLRARGLTHRYRHTVFEDLDLAVRSGQVLGVRGASGCGKSTLLRLLAGLEAPSEGVVEYLGDDGAWVERRPKGFVLPIFQDPVASLSPRWPLWRSLAEPEKARGQRRTKQEWISEASARLAEMGLGEIDPQARPDKLSVGQAQRVAILRCITARPRVLLADEPTASLDVISARRVDRMLADAADEGTAVVLVTHDLSRLERTADRVVEFRGTKVVEL